MNDFARFSEASKGALQRAREEAARAHHSYLGTGHLLLGLLGEGDGLAAQVLGDLGVELGTVRAAMEAVPGRDERIIVQQVIPTSRVREVIAIAFAEARRVNSAHVGTEHLLLGLLIEGEGLAAHVLEDLGVTLDRVRQELSRTSGQDPVGAAREGRRREDAWDLLLRLHEELHRAHPEDPSEGAASQRADVSLLSSLLPPRVGVAARSALALAEEEAVMVGAAQVGTDHLLLGLLRQTEGGAARVLHDLGVDLGRARAAASATPGRAVPSPVGRQREAGPELPDALGRAGLRADGDGRCVETGDLLIAISQPGAGRAAEILRRLGVVHLKLEEQIVLVLGDEPTG